MSMGDFDWSGNPSDEHLLKRLKHLHSLVGTLTDMLDLGQP